MSSGIKPGTSRTEGRPLNDCAILAPYLFFLRFTNFGRVTTTARDANYCGPVTVPSPNETTPSGTTSSTLIFLIQKSENYAIRKIECTLVARYLALLSFARLSKKNVCFTSNLFD